MKLLWFLASGVGLKQGGRRGSGLRSNEKPGKRFWVYLDCRDS